MTDQFVEGSGLEADVSVDTWLKDSLPMLPGIVRSVAQREVVLAAREFFTRSYAWRDTISNVNIRAGRKQYWATPFDDYTNVIAVLGVNYHGGQNTNGRWLTAMTRKPAAIYESDLPSGFYLARESDSFFLYPDMSKDQPAAMDVYVALRPKETVTHLPRIASLHFYDSILSGFYARVLMHPNKPYTNPTLALAHRRQFISDIARYRSEIKQGFANTQDWAFPAWGVK